MREYNILILQVKFIFTFLKNSGVVTVALLNVSVDFLLCSVYGQRYSGNLNARTMAQILLFLRVYYSLQYIIIYQHGSARDLCENYILYTR